MKWKEYWKWSVKERSIYNSGTNIETILGIYVLVKEYEIKQIDQSNIFVLILIHTKNILLFI